MKFLEDVKAWLRKELGHSWVVLVGFLALSGLIGVFSSVRALIELFSLVLMAVYRVTDPWLEPVLESWGNDNKDHVSSNLILYALASLVLTGVFVVIRRRRMLKEFEEDERIESAQRKAEELDRAAGNGAVSGGLLGTLAGAALGLVFVPAFFPLVALGAAAGGLSGASNVHDETLIAQASRPDLDAATRQRLQAKATRNSSRVLLSTLGKSLVICLAIGLMTYHRSPAWNLAREMELRADLVIAQATCKLEPHDTLALRLAPTDREIDGQKPNLCDDLLEPRADEVKAQVEARELGAVKLSPFPQSTGAGQ